MANTYSQIYLQCVFAVKYREAKIKAEWKQTLLGVIGNLIYDVYKYIANQELHHKKQSFKEEYLAFPEKFEVPYDERYVFHDLI